MRQGPAAQLWLVIVDASASTQRHGALRDAKGVLAALFDSAYRARARLALLNASGASPRWARQGLKASAALQGWLAALGGGGGTPLAEALALAGPWLARRRAACPEEQVRCLVITDGRVRELEAQPLGCATWLLDIERGALRLGRGRVLAQQLGAQYLHIDGV
ncbi:VWA domain-containing protein [Pseudomonas sp. NPDC007930]|uniref:VWA domain-containing protein n=1 Tax=Pseudomonas sp. NPDC007930 TaxID=3364417 RepID=UPI0036E2E49A